MNTFFVCGVPISLDAVQQDRQGTEHEDAWLRGEYLTLRVTDDMREGVRVHTNGKSFPGRSASSMAGRWIALEDIIDTSHALANSRALPGVFTHVAWVVIPSGCVINVGVASPLYGYSGGGVQAEYVSGPRFGFEQAEGKHWHGAVGNA
jgi:hypothetical protein